MRMVHVIPFALCLALGSGGWAQTQEAPRAEGIASHVATRANALRPDPRRLKWQRIPWMTNLAEGLKVAKQEGRPVFLWGSDDEPLERC